VTNHSEYLCSLQSAWFETHSRGLAFRKKEKLLRTFCSPVADFSECLCYRRLIQNTSFGKEVLVLVALISVGKNTRWAFQFILAKLQLP